MHQFLTRTLSVPSVPYVYDQHVLKGPFQICNFYAYAEPTHKNLMLMLKVCISSYPYAHGTYQFLMCMLSIF